MLALRSLLPHLGLLLCLALHFSPSLSASDNGSCVVFDEVYDSNNLGINTTAEVSGGNTVYTVMVPVNDSVSAVILKALKENSPVGTWNGADQNCNDSSVYNLTSLSGQVFQATWTVPNSEDVTKVNLQVFIVINRTAVKSSVKVEQVNSSILTPTPESFETSQTMTTAKTTAKTTAENTANTTAVSTAKTTARSLAIRTLSSPLAGALHILLVFLVSKLLF
ncbi:placenta-expressed transcript 1 protein [Grammomys surdaster]|uniref:placenta-expressed transcript 1 protein n=1 Tax=Grammomys surdaster TaxID=491861 RepID=UPI00109F60A2|nr:placenta-expressed transcript 1 protein [Grammomys surdaster]